MSYRVKAQVDGLADLLARLNGLKRQVASRILRKAVAEAGKIILKVAKQKAPRESGLLRKSLGRKVKVYRSSGTAVAIVGPRLGFKQVVRRARGKWFPADVASNPVKYAHLVELGTVRSKAQAFLRPALQTHAGTIRKVMETQIDRGLAEAAKQAQGG